jgi:uncharacterized protein YndB with AHSA1/START domain
MASISVDIVIPAPPRRVWSEVARLETHQEWMGDVVGIDFEAGPTTGVGTRMRVATRVGPLRTNDLIEITEWQPPRVMGVSHRGLIRGTGQFRLEPRGDSSTLFTWAEKLYFPWYLGGPITAMAAAPILRRIWRKNLARLAERF